MVVQKLGNAYYWVFILGIFSGLRTNEMAQMRLEDIKKESNIWFLHVEDSEQTNVKTANAIRKVPVHPQLMELGFIDHVTEFKEAKERQIVLGTHQNQRWICQTVIKTLQ